MYTASVCVCASLVPLRPVIVRVVQADCFPGSLRWRLCLDTRLPFLSCSRHPSCFQATSRWRRRLPGVNTRARAQGMRLCACVCVRLCTPRAVAQVWRGWCEEDVRRCFCPLLRSRGGLEDKRLLTMTFFYFDACMCACVPACARSWFFVLVRVCVGLSAFVSW